MRLHEPRLGIALGSGSARGWAHIGVLAALEEAGIVPRVVAGTSIGALVGAAYASDRLDRLREWVLEIDWWDIVRYMDLRRGGVEGERLMRAFGERVDDVSIETLAKPFGAVATDLQTGREVWFRKDRCWRRCGRPSPCRACSARSSSGKAGWWTGDWWTRCRCRCAGPWGRIG